VNEANRNLREVTLAIFPFENLTEGKGLDVFCRSFSIDLITELSRFRQFSIIAQQSLAKEAEHSFQQIRPDYVVKGSFRYHQDQIRINAQLIKSDTNHIAWADRYEGNKESIFSIQEDLLKQIVTSLQQQLDHDLLTHIRKKSPVDLSVYEYWLYGMEELKNGTIESDEKAREYFKQAIAIDPTYSLAYSGMSLTYFNEWTCQLWDRWDISRNGAFEWAAKAIDLDKQNHIAAMVLGRCYLYERKFEMAEHFLRKALRLNPNDVDNLIQIASCLVFLGYPNEAEVLYEKLQELNPINDDRYSHVGALIALELGQYEKCLQLGLRAKSFWVDFNGILAAAYFHLGDHSRALSSWRIYLEQFEQKILKEKLTDTDQAVQWMINTSPYKDKTVLKPFWDFIGTKTLDTDVPPEENRVEENENYFYRRNEFWEISYEGKTIQLVEVKGFHDLARLLENPEKQFHCTELIGGGLKVAKEFVFDDRAKRTYQKKLVELKEEIQWCEENNDSGRAPVLQKEYDDLVNHLSSSLGLAGKTRKAHDPVDKARSAITWRIRNAIQKIEKENPDLAKHLTVSIKTGIFCSYNPEKPTRWTID
jgi:TolB-like protein